MTLTDAAAQKDRLVMRRGREIRQACEMVKNFRSLYPDSPIYIARNPDRSQTFLRWRWTKAAGQARRVELSSPEIAGHLRKLPSDALADFARYEEYRSNFNLRIATLTYEAARLEDHMRLVSTVRQMQRLARQSGSGRPADKT